MLTYYATFPEVCESEKETIFLSNTKSICDVVYFSLGFALAPVLVSLGINIRIVALLFLPLVLTMVIPFFMLKENRADEVEEIEPLTLRKSLSCSVKNGIYMYWLSTVFFMTIGLQLFLGGINELFSSTGLNMTVVMASSFAPSLASTLGLTVEALGMKTGMLLGLLFPLIGIIIFGIILRSYKKEQQSKILKV